MAYNTFKRLKDNPVFGLIYSTTIKKLKSLDNPIERAVRFHNEIDRFNGEVLADPAVQANIACKKGCGACCHTQVSVTSDEAELLASIVMDGHEVDLKRLYIQSEAQNDDKKWFKTPYDIRRCVFLNDKNECSVYENRPAVCRTNMVVSDPKDCSTIDGKQRAIRLINTEKADMAIMAGFTVSRSSGALPYLLWKTLHRQKGPRSLQGEMGMGVVRQRLKIAQNTVSKIFSM